MNTPIRVLIVEDDFAVARLHGRYLDAIDGFELVGAELTAADAAARLRVIGVDLVLLDMFLPDATGLDLLRQIRAAASTPLDVIMVTAAPDPELVRQALQLGVVDYLLKPFSPEVFRDRLVGYAARRAQLNSVGTPTLSQEQIDSMQGRPSTPRQLDIPKGLSVTTAKLVQEALRSRDQTVTAADLGEMLGMSRVSARRYLEYFATIDRVEIKPKYGDTGRPQHLYRWINGPMF